MSHAFDAEALASVPTRPTLGTLRVERRPEGIEWAPPPPPPATTSVPLLEAFHEAWTGTAQALAFRHERLLNLAYVPTTTHSDALCRSAQAIALAPEPPLAASTWLALSVRAVAGNPAVEVPAGLAVQSVPVGAGRPQVYETDDVLHAHVTWNELGLRRAAPPTPDPSTAATGGLVAIAGLGAGRRLAVTGSVAERPFAAATILTRSEVLQRAGAGPRLRRLSWAEPLASGLGQPIHDARVFELGGECALFGAHAAAWNSLPDHVRFELSVPRGGLLRLVPPRADCAVTPLPYASFARLAGEPRVVTARGDVWIAASRAGVFRSTDAGASWVPTGRAAWQVSAACWSDAGLWLGTESHGVLRSTDAGLTWEVQRGGTIAQQTSQGLAITLGRLPRCAVHALGAFPSGSGTELLLAGTSAGPYYQLVGDPAWYPHADGLPLRGPRTGMGGPRVSAVALDAGTAVLVGTDRGLFRAPSLDGPWQSIELPSEGTVAALLADGSGAVLVAFESGDLYRLDAQGASALGSLPVARPGTHAVRAACATSAGYWLGGDAGCFWSADGESWSCVCGQRLTALAALPDGGVLAAAQLTGSVDDEWPGFALLPHQLDLGRHQPLAKPGPALVVDDATGASLVVLVRGIETRELEAFGVQRRVTRLLLEPEPQLSGFARRTTRVFPSVRDLGVLRADVPEVTAPDAAPAPRIEALLGQELLVDARIPDPTGRAVILSGPLLRARVRGGSTLVEHATGRRLRLGSDVLATVRSLPEHRDGSTLLRVLTEDGLDGTVSTAELALLPGDPRATPASVLRRVAGFERGDTTARLLLDQPLDVPLDASTTSIYANVVSASHGQRVEREVLGSGDPGQRAQRFKLTLPLCWLPSPRGAEPVLEVRVSDELWTRVDQRAQLGSGERGYALELDTANNTWICFGDGEHGARPPAGIENITARYRTGGGSAGNQPAGAIRLLRSRSQGLKSAKNLLAAAGGCDIEPLDDLRQRIPLHARLPDHIVSLPDFLDHLSTLDEVAKVAGRQLWNGHAHVLCLTIATTNRANGWALDPNSRLASSMLTLSERAAVVIDSVEVSWFGATLDVAVDPLLDATPVLENVRTALQSAFGFDARTMGDPVLPSALVRTAMSVAGVRNAALRQLYPVGGEANAEVRPLAGAPARYDAATRRVSPARLWLIGPNVSASETTREQRERGLLVRLMEAP